MIPFIPCGNPLVYMFTSFYLVLDYHSNTINLPIQLIKFMICCHYFITLVVMSSFQSLHLIYLLENKVGYA